MEELHVAIATYLREQRRTTDARRPVADTEPHRTALERDARILALWREQRPVPHCVVCGRPVDDDGGCFDLADMQLRRQCEQHYCPF